MPVLGVTGSIATGKSVVMSYLASTFSAKAFSADDCVRRLLTTDQTVMLEVFQKFGYELRTSDGSVDRAALRDVVFRDPNARAKLEAILHPRVRSEWTVLLEKTRSGVATRWLLLEIPLLFETGAEAKMDAIIVTACSVHTQMERLSGNRGISKETAELIIASQDPQNSKIARSQHVLWTDCPIVRLYEQVRFLSQHLIAVYG